MKQPARPLGLTAPLRLIANLHWSLRWLAGAGLLLALLWGLLLWDMQVQLDLERKDAHRQLQSVAYVGAQELRSVVRAADLSMVELRQSWQADRENFDATVRQHQRQLEIGEGFDLTVTGPDGRLLYSSAQAHAEGLDLSGEADFRLHRDSGQDTLDISQPLSGRMFARGVIQFSRPLLPVQGKFAGVIAFSVPPEYLSRTFQSLNLGQDSILTLVRDDGALVLRSVKSEHPQAVAAPAGEPGSAPSAAALQPLLSVSSLFIQGLSDSGLGQWTSPFDQVQRTYAWCKLGGYPLTLFMGQPSALLYRLIDKQRRHSLLAGTSVSLLFLGALYWLMASAQARIDAVLQLSRQVVRLTRSQAELNASQRALRELSSRQMNIKEAERKRIAQEIHDEFGQRLTVLRMDVAMLPRAVQADPAALVQQAQGLKDQIDDILVIVRDLAGKLHPAALHMGLAIAAEGLIGEFQSCLGIPCELSNQLPPGLVLDEMRAIGVFRILQESLTNVARHAQASRIEVTLAVQDGQLRLRVHDDGCGFSLLSERARPSFGLSGMRERASALGGRLEVTSWPGHGTTVEALIPLQALVQSASVLPTEYDSLSMGSHP